MVLTCHDRNKTAFFYRIKDTLVISSHKDVAEHLTGLLADTYYHRLPAKYRKRLGRKASGSVSGRYYCCKFHQKDSIE